MKSSKPNETLNVSKHFAYSILPLTGLMITIWSPRKWSCSFLSTIICSSLIVILAKLPPLKPEDYAFIYSFPGSGTNSLSRLSFLFSFGHSLKKFLCLSIMSALDRLKGFKSATIFFYAFQSAILSFLVASSIFL